MFLTQTRTLLRITSRTSTSRIFSPDQRCLSTFNGSLDSKVENFKRDVSLHLPADGQNVVFASAWLVTDNVFVDLMHKHFPSILSGMHLVTVDTLHLFPETLECAERVQKKYGVQALWQTPQGAKTLAEFVEQHGDCETMDAADFDYISKVEPFQRVLRETAKDILITGRRMDQKSMRIKLNVWEPGTRNFNPMATFTWTDILAYADACNVPVNKAHNYVFRSHSAISAKDRHKSDLPWVKHDLGKPYWQASEAELKGEPPAEFAYLHKSFGDVHTTVPVEMHESEYAGRYVRRATSDKAIQTRTAVTGSPHGGMLVNLLVKDEAEATALKETSVRTIELNERQACDVFCLVHGAFSPLTGFMDEQTYNAVVKDMRLPKRQLFGMPITLDLHDVSGIKEGDRVILRWAGEDVAVLEASSIWKPNKVIEAKRVYGTSSVEHPSVHLLMAEQGNYYAGGRLHGLTSPNFQYPVQTPTEVRDSLPQQGDVVAFQNRNPIHRAHFELLKCAHRDMVDSVLLIHPTCGPTQPGDIDSLVRIQTYEALRKETEKEFPMFRWAYLPYSMKMAGPREAIQHMIIRKNFGATHFIIGRDMAGTKSTVTGDDIYGPYEAQDTGKKHSAELGMTVVHYENMVYTGPQDGYMQESSAKQQGKNISKLSGTEFRRRLRAGEDIPEWFAFKSVVDILRKAGGKAFC